MHRSDPCKRVRLGVGLEHKTKTNVISVTVSTLSKGLARESIAEVIDPIASNRPTVSDGYAVRMAPNLGGSAPQR